MSIFDSDLVSKPSLTQETYYELVKNLRLGIDLLSKTGAIICREQKPGTLANIMEQHIERKSNIGAPPGHFVSLYDLKPIDNPLTVPDILLKQKGRPVVSIDCSSLCKGDAIDFLYWLSNLSTSFKPIVIIYNISNIPPEDANHDAPETVKDLLYELWKDKYRELQNPSGEKFVVRKRDYTVLITIPVSERPGINNSRAHKGLEQIQIDSSWMHWNLYNEDELHNYVKRGWITSALANEVRLFVCKWKSAMIPLSYIGSPKSPLQFGKAVENAIFSILIMSGCELFIPALDDDGVDVLVKRPDGKYVAVQIKATSRATKDPGLFAAISHQPRQDYWFVFFSESLKRVWVMNSQEFIENASPNTQGSNKGKFSINFGKYGTLRSNFIVNDLSKIVY